MAPKVKGGSGATGERQLTGFLSTFSLGVATKRGASITPYSCARVGIEARWEDPRGKRFLSALLFQDGARGSNSRALVWGLHLEGHFLPGLSAG